MLTRIEIRTLAGFLLSFAFAVAARAEVAAPRFLPLGDLPGDRDRAEPVAVSTDGSVVIGNGSSDAGPEAFRWTAATGAVGLGDLPGGGFFSDAEVATPDAGVVAGTSASAIGVEPFRWTAATGMQALVPFGAGDGCTVAAMSRSGDAVAGTCRTRVPGLDDPFPSAWIWTRADGFAWPAGFPYFGQRSGLHAVTDDGRSAFGWIERNAGSVTGTVRDAVRFEAGADGTFGTGDDRQVALDPAFILDPEIPIMASADGRKAVGVGERRGQPYVFLWSIGSDRRAGTRDDSFRSILWRGTTAYCFPFGISADGRTPFGVCSGATGPYFPAAWDAAKGWIRLGTAPQGSQGGYAIEASADGRTVVGFFEVQKGPAPWNLAFVPFRWTASGGLSLFGTVTPESDRCGWCMAVSSDGGDVLGAEGGLRGDGLFLWSSGRGRRHLDEMPGDWRGSYAYAMSEDGTVVAGKSGSADGDRAFRWTEATGMTPVGPAGVRGMEVFLSDDGETLLGVARWDPEYLEARSAFFHRASSGAVESLGSGFAGTTSCYPAALSGDGSTVVGSCVGGAQDPAFRWTAASGLVPLQLPTDHFDWWCSGVAVSRNGAVVGMTCRRPIGEATAESRALLWTGLGLPLQPLGSHFDRLEMIELSADGSVALLERLDGSTRRDGGYWRSTGVDLSLGEAQVEQPAALDLSTGGVFALFQEHGRLTLSRTAAFDRTPLPFAYFATPTPVRGGAIAANGALAAVAYEPLAPSRGPHLGPPARIWLTSPVAEGRWLDELLADAGADVAGWSLDRIVSVSQDGKRLVGNGIDPQGKARAWVVELP